MILSVNEIIRYDDGILERVLWVDEGNIIAFTIDINKKNALPELKRVSDIMEGIDNGQIVRVLDDSFIVNVKDEELSPKDIDIRDKAWNVIQAIAGKGCEPSIFYKSTRGELIDKVISEQGVSKVMVYTYLRRYWQRGKTKNAVLPNYSNSGGKGKEKTLKDKKVGRPRKNADIIGVGINVDEETKKIFRIAINQFYNTTKENPLTTAYELMLKKFYADDFRYDNGVKKPILKPLVKVPTLDQFRYWFNAERNIKKEISSRKSAKKFELQHRAILGSSTQDVMGPGSLYQIDATVADVYLVSRYDRNSIIGRPIVYVVIDAFSRMITGIYVGLEGPSWAGAMMALANAAMDKVSFCKEYGIEITEEQWLSHHLPEAILADRGEIEGKRVETLINSLQVTIKNTPPFRADWKGIVEQNFRTINLKIKPFLPGFINPDFRERGARDYRLDAVLDIYEFTQIMIKCVLYHNNEYWLKNYSREEMMISDNVDCIPAELWRWGIKNRAGKLRSFPEDVIKLNLMPTEKARVTSKGIKFKGMYYGCESALKEMWFEKARKDGSWSIEISYDNRNMNQIYIRLDNGRSFEKCFLLDYETKYMNKTLEEIEYLIEYEKLQEKKNKEKVVQSKVDLMADIESIVRSAEKKTKSAQIPGESKTSKLKGIRDNRKVEKEKNRENEAFELAKVDINDVAQIISLDSKKENTSESNDIIKRKIKDSLDNSKKEYPIEVTQEEDEDAEDVVDELELLRRIQKEKLNGNKR